VSKFKNYLNQKYKISLKNIIFISIAKIVVL